MAQQPDPTSETLKSALTQMETPNTDVIVAGGASSSELLNDLRGSLIEDIVELDRRTEEQGEQQALSNTIFNVQNSALSTFASSLESRLPTVSGRHMADFFTNTFVDGDSNAEVNNTYGQVTLPITNSLEKLVSEDSRGNVWIPKGAQLLYSYKATAPDEVDWLQDDTHVRALDQRNDTAWWRQRETSGTVWVRVRIPVNLNSNRLVNTICLHPYPLMSFDLLSVEYKNPAGVYTTADLSYLPRWSNSLSRVQNVGNVRIFIPQSQVVELRLKLSTQSAWGFSKISVKQLEFSATATLIVDYSSYNPDTLTTVNVFGKDQNSLSFLTTSINGATASVALTQNTGGLTPVITQVEVRS